MRRTALTTTAATAVLVAGGAATAPVHAGIPIQLGTGEYPSIEVAPDGAALVAWPTLSPPQTIHCRVPRGWLTTGCPAGGTIPAGGSVDGLSHVVFRSDGQPSVIFREPFVGVDGVLKTAHSADGGLSYGTPQTDPSTGVPGLDFESEVLPYHEGATQRYLVATGADSTVEDTLSIPSGGADGLDLFGVTIATAVGLGPAPGELLRVAKVDALDPLLFRRRTAGSPNAMASWSAAAPVPGTESASEPEIASAYGAWPAVLGYQRIGAIDVRPIVGAAFGAPVVATPLSGGAAWDMKRDPSGRLHIVYYRPNIGTFWQFSHDNGAHWSLPTQILPKTEAVRYLKVDAAADGGGWIAYRLLNGDAVRIASLDPYAGPVPPPVPPQPPVPVPPQAGGDAVKFPAKLRVRRAGAKDGRLDILAEITKRATGKLKVEYESGGRTHRFEATIPESGVVKIDKRLPPKMRSSRSGILEIDYAGNDRVRRDDVRLRAASGKANLERRTTTLKDGRLRVDGTISSRARGVVRIRLGYVDADRTLKFRRMRAKIAKGKWKLDERLSGAAAAGGQLSIQFTGYLPAKMRGEQTAKRVP